MLLTDKIKNCESLEGLRAIALELFGRLQKNKSFVAIRCINDGEEYDCIMDACRAYNAKPANIKKVLDGIIKQTNGKKFEYVNLN
jgi:hypothetical protein